MKIQKLLVISDTHHNIPSLDAVLKWAGDKTRDDAIDTAVFLGDGLPDIEFSASAGLFSRWIKVRGNNDYASDVPDKAVFEFCGRRFFICHGHRHRLEYGYDTLIAAARNTESEVALFGHLHVPVCESAGGLLLINPGSVGWPRGDAGATFAVIDCIPEKPLEVKFWSIDGNDEILEFNP